MSILITSDKYNKYSELKTSFAICNQYNYPIYVNIQFNIIIKWYTTSATKKLKKGIYMYKKLFLMAIMTLLITNLALPMNVFANEILIQSKEEEIEYQSEGKDLTVIPINSNDSISPYAIPAPPVGSAFTYIGKRKGKSWESRATTEAISIALGKTFKGYLATKTVLPIINWLVDGHQPTNYAKVYVKGTETSPYQFVTTSKYLWYEDSQYRTYKTSTQRTKITSCSNYTPYCWRK